MPSRLVTIDGAAWEVVPAGAVTPYAADEYALLFARGDGAAREVRVTRYTPVGAPGREAALAALSDDDLRRYFALSQRSDTSPEAGYRR
jgi:hypothetical protein